MDKKSGYILAIAILGIAVVVLSVVCINLFNENRVADKIFKMSCKTTYNESQCLDGVEMMKKNPDMIDMTYKYMK